MSATSRGCLATESGFVRVRPASAPWYEASKDAGAGQSIDHSQRQRRRWRWELLRWQWEHSSLERLRHCRLYGTGGQVAVVAGLGRSYVAGCQTCGSVWACPVCSAIIRQRRAELIEAGGLAWTAQEGHWLAFLTLTLRHGQFESLAALYGGLRACWKSLRQGRWWRELGWQGFWRSVEVTYGANGWHPHLHTLLLGEGAPAEVGELGAEVSSRWCDLVVGAGLRATSFERGARLQMVTTGGDSLAQYLTKVLDGEGRSWGVGMELARADMKRGGKGLSPFEVLELASTGEAGWAPRWWEYEAATKGRRCIESSRGMSRLVGVADVEDSELVAQDEGGEVVCVLDGLSWRRIARAGLVPDLLEKAEEGDGPATVSFLEALLRVVA